MEISVQLPKLCQIERSRRCIIILGVVAVTYLMLQSFMLPYGNALKSLLPDYEIVSSVKGSSLSQISVQLSKEVELGPSNVVVVNQNGQSNGELYNGINDNLEEKNGSVLDVVGFKGKVRVESGGLDKLSNPKHLDVTGESSLKPELDSVGNLEQIVKPDHQFSQNSSSLELNGKPSFDKNEDENENVKNQNQVSLVLPNTVKELRQRDHAPVTITHRRKKDRPGMAPITVISMDEMNRRLARHLVSSSKMKTQWSSLRDCDKELIDAKSMIINAPVSLVDTEVYAPAFRNVSRFVRSYELMEKTLKVYVYRDGEKPIFHQPILKGLYASEGWFMKLMEGNKHFVVKNPEKAHLFYMPFSSRMLEYAMYVPGSHNRTKLRQFVKGYAEKIAGKYPFWNRTGGTDHFLVACHDWALYETRHHMENSIKALCNADVTIGFKIGRDVSLPETFVRYARNPLRDLGGKPPSERNILAFYAGNRHGYLRPILLKYWKNKDPDMRIYDLLPTGISRKMNYMQHMKSSKYCICPKGFEVNSPRVVESIFYECVPVIISDNFVPPFFEVLNWEAFSVIVAEKDIPQLKNILLSIPEAKYLEMQLAVRKIQRHFLWHARPVKYDLFYMTLHSIWYSRVFQTQRK